MKGQLTVLTPDDRTLLEISKLAKAGGVVLVERGGKTALCGKANIPPNWHVMSVGVKASAQ